MWKGAEAFAAAEALVAVAEGHREKRQQQQREREGKGGNLSPSSPSLPPVSSRARMLRPAEDARQARDFALRGAQRSLGCSATPVGGAEARRALPGVSLPVDGGGEGGGGRGGGGGGEPPPAAEAAALVVEGGLVVEPGAYLRHLWAATVEAARAAGGGAVLDRDSPPVRSLAELDGGRGSGEERGGGQGSKRRRRFDVVIVAAGAAAGAVAEVGGESGTAGVGSCELVQGWTATVAPPSSSSSPFPEAALLGKTYAAPRRGGSENDGEKGNGAVVAVGATRSAVPVSAEEALSHCAARGQGVGPGAASEAGGASRELLERFSRLWPAAAGEGGQGAERRGWAVVSAASGVRARPRRSGVGRPPLAGKLESGSLGTGGNWWIIGGLGSRGLLYSAWLGREVARAALADVDLGDGGEGGGGRREGKGGGDSSLDPELTRWKRWKKL
jgi:hypothetical protein